MPEVFYSAHTKLGGTMRRLLTKRWEIKELPVTEVVKQAEFPEFLWVNLGRISNTSAPISLLRSVAGRQAEMKSQGFVFISGSVPKKKHEHFAEMIYKYFSNPLLVQVDLVGDPDVVSTLEKFRALKLQRPAADAFQKKILLIEVPNSDLRSESGRLSARLISEVFGVPMVELGNWIGSKKAALSKTPDSESIQSVLQDYARVALFRKAVGGDVAFRQWLRTEHSMLEGKSPLDWIKSDRVREVGDFVEDALTGQPT